MKKLKFITLILRKHLSKTFFYGVASAGRSNQSSDYLRYDGRTELHNNSSEKLASKIVELFVNQNCVFQHGNNPCHKARSEQTYLHQENINALVKPPYSPDISSIEKLWGALKYEVNLSGTI